MFDSAKFKHFTKVEPIEKGWSGDEKYYVENEDGNRLLLRVSDISLYNSKKTEYEMMQKVAWLGVPMQQPVDFGVCNDGKSVHKATNMVTITPET